MSFIELTKMAWIELTKMAFIKMFMKLKLFD
jgi:hypothetical protein